MTELKKNAPSLKDAVKNAGKGKKGGKQGGTKSAGAKQSSSLCDPRGSKAEKERIVKLAEMLAKSETGKAVLEASKQGGYKIDFALGMEGALGVCDPNKKVVSLSPDSNDAENVATLAHELRHAVQFINGMGAHIDHDNTKTQFMMTRAMEADAESNAGLATWELKEQGIEEPWEMFKQDGPTVASAFEKEVEKVGGVDSQANKNKALTAAFKGWYKNHRIRAAYDEGHVENLKEIEEEGLSNMLKFDRSMKAEDIVTGVCVDAKGSCYFTGKKAQIESKNLLSVSEKTMRDLTGFMDKRKEDHGLEPDESLGEIPVHKSQSRNGANKKGQIRKRPVGMLSSDEFQAVAKKAQTNKKIVPVRKKPVMMIRSDELAKRQIEARKKIELARKEKADKEASQAAMAQKVRQSGR